MSKTTKKPTLETVEAFLKRGGKVQLVPMGKSGKEEE